MRTFVVDGKEMQFNLTFFNNIFKTKAKQEKKGIGEFEEELADAIFVEKSTVHAWRNRVNGPSDLDKVQQIAEFFKLEAKDFLLEVDEMITYENREVNKNQDVVVVEFGDREKDAFKRVYKEMLNFMDLRLKYDGEMLDESRAFSMIDIELECWPEDQKDTEEYFYLEEDAMHGTLEGHLTSIYDSWADVDFNAELEKVSRALEEEMVDLPNGIYILLEKYIDFLESANSIKDIFLACDLESSGAENYMYECIEETYFRNERIFSTIRENIRMLIFKLKN